MMPLWDRPLNLIPGNRRRKRIMEMEQTTGVKAILSCIDQRYFTPEWLGRQIDRKCIEDMQPLVGPAGKGIDVSGEPGEYHSTTLDAPLFKQRVELTKFTKKSKVVDFGGSPFREGDFLYMDIEEAVLKPKEENCHLEAQLDFKSICVCWALRRRRKTSFLEKFVFHVFQLRTLWFFRCLL